MTQPVRLPPSRLVLLPFPACGPPLPIEKIQQWHVRRTNNRKKLHLSSTPTTNTAHASTRRQGFSHNNTRRVNTAKTETHHASPCSPSFPPPMAVNNNALCFALRFSLQVDVNVASSPSLTPPQNTHTHTYRPIVIQYMSSHATVFSFLPSPNPTFQHTFNFSAPCAVRPPSPCFRRAFATG